MQDIVVIVVYLLACLPAAFNFSFTCSDCLCCGVGKDATDPADEGVWEPSGTWKDRNVTWTFNPTPANNAGVWYFYGSAATSRSNGNATEAQQADWDNLCNWYSSKTTAPNIVTNIAASLNKRATRLPPEDAVIHVYSKMAAVSDNAKTFKNAYFWGPGGKLSRVLTYPPPATTLSTTEPALGTPYGATFVGSGSDNNSIVLNGATFANAARNVGTVEGGARFYGATNFGRVNGGAEFYVGTNIGTINGGAIFNGGDSLFTGSNNGAAGISATVNEGAVFNDSSSNEPLGRVNGGAVFNDRSENFGGRVEGGAIFNDFAINSFNRVNGGATFNDEACSSYYTGEIGPPCTAKFAAHPTDLPTCNGNAPLACDSLPDVRCGCG